MSAASAAIIAFPGASRFGQENMRAALKAHRVPDGLSESLLREAAGWPGYEDEAALSCALASRMRPAPIDFKNAKAILLIGPRGAGKSAVAGKIAHVAEEIGRKVERRSAANGLIAAQMPEQGVLTIIDSEGFNPRNKRARAAFASLGEQEDVESIGIVSALGDAEESAEIVSDFAYKRVIVTGLDMTKRLGSVVSAVCQGARIAHVTRSPHNEGSLDLLTPDALAKALLRGR